MSNDQELSKQLIRETEENSRYYPYLSRDEKISAYKSAIVQSLDFAVHPDHLSRVRKKLDSLEKFWKEDTK